MSVSRLESLLDSSNKFVEEFSCTLSESVGEITLEK